MSDRMLSGRVSRRGRRAFGAGCALAAFIGATASAAAQTPPDGKATPPAAAPTSATPAPAPALPAPSEPKPATDGDEDDERTDAPKAAPVPDSEARPDARPPAASTDALVTNPELAARSLPEQPDVNQIDDGQMGSHQEHWLLGIGARETFVTGKGYDPFSTDNVLPQVTFDLGRAFYVSGPLSLAGLIAWDYGSTHATARGADTSLVVHRLSAGAEGRYHLLRRLYVFGRVAPGALNSSATLHDQVIGLDRQAHAWVFTSDFSLGTAFEFAGDARGASTRPRAWIGADGGYSWSASSKLAFKPTGSDSSTPARLEPLRFADLAVRGAFLRLTATLTY